MRKHTIKNGRELVLRAQGHARQDRITQATYGRGTVNGDVKLEACWIGCLSTPHRKPQLRSFLRKLGFDGNGFTQEFHLDSQESLSQLENEFGINLCLARVCEAIFESRESPEEGTKVTVRLAKAIAACEGKRLTPKQIVGAWSKIVDIPDAVHDHGSEWPEDDEQVEAFFAYLEKRAA